MTSPTRSPTDPNNKELAEEAGRRLAEICATPARIEDALGFMRTLIDGTIRALSTDRSLRASDRATIAERARDYLAIVEAGAACLRATTTGTLSVIPALERTEALRRYRGRADTAFRFLSQNIMRTIRLDPSGREWVLDGYALAVMGLAALRGSSPSK